MQLGSIGPGSKKWDHPEGKRAAGHGPHRTGKNAGKHFVENESADLTAFLAPCHGMVRIPISGSEWRHLRRCAEEAPCYGLQLDGFFIHRAVGIKPHPLRDEAANPRRTRRRRRPIRRARAPHGARHYNGMLPCFFGGFESRLFSSIANAVISFRLVKRGSMISSMYPLSAAI